MARRKIGQFTLVLGSFLMLSACENPPLAEDGAATRPARAARGGAQDAEAPDVFKVNDKALWDGRFSLGGIWVAHPSVTNPERVMIRNPANGKSVEGALFRRERDQPGPALQVSADAAGALGMLAGQPTVLDVVAMRRVEAPVPQPKPEAAPAAAPAVAAAAGATAAVASIETTKLAPEGAAAPAAAKPAATAGARPAARTAAAAEAASEAAAAAPEPAPKKKWWQKKAPALPVAEPAPAAAATAGAAATAAPKAAAAPKATGAPAPASSLSLPYLQIGTFTLEANAEQAAAALVKAGLAALVKSSTSGGKASWRVIVGPAATAAERNAIEKTVVGLGYKDAYPVAG